MPVFGARSLRALCSTGVPVTFRGVGTYPDGVPVKGNLDQAVQNKLSDQGFGGVDVPMPIISLPFNAFDTMPGDGDQINVDGVLYTTGDGVAEDDGAFLSYTLVQA